MDRYGTCTYTPYLTTLVEDTSLKASDQVHLIGYHHKWKKPEVLVGCVLYTEALKPMSLLSLTLQGEKAYILSVVLKTLPNRSWLCNL